MALPFPKPLVRVRLWIGLITLSGIMVLYLYLKRSEANVSEETPSELPVFQWIPIHNITQLEECRNSQQGHTLIVDELGYVCSPGNVESSGCCKDRSLRFECSRCKSDCCSVYEHCVSCCLHPDKQPLLRSILRRSTVNYHPLYSSLKDQFELCLAKCRTSSQSVQHENTYRDPGMKYCYGTDTSSLLPESVQHENTYRDPGMKYCYGTDTSSLLPEVP
ncbi:SREBP regulating gene protein-like [Halichondria panicea]|uniref:SREBP regulating gene protein-like n=1 Tax=Halichondria panicea TaxID=6063 RepID=UPI00312B7C29